MCLQHGYLCVWGLLSRLDESNSVSMRPRLERDTLEMEVRETQSYTAVVKYTGKSPWMGKRIGPQLNKASMLTVANTVAVTPKVR